MLKYFMKDSAFSMLFYWRRALNFGRYNEKTKINYKNLQIRSLDPKNASIILTPILKSFC